MRFDLRMVREADIVLCNLRDLHSSLGTSDEILYAFISGKPVIGFIDDDSEVKNIHPWKIEQIFRIVVLIRIKITTHSTCKVNCFIHYQ